MHSGNALNRSKRHPRGFRPVLVGICGGSGSGKTWLARKLQQHFGGAAGHLSLDDFYRDRAHLPPARRARLNFDHPRAIDWVLLERTLQAFAAGRPCLVPQYDFSTHCRSGKVRRFRGVKILLVEGLWLLRRPSVRRQFALTTFLDCSRRLRLERRLQRDVRERGRTRAAVRRQFRLTVEPMHQRYVAPQKKWADVVLDGGCRPGELKKLVQLIERLPEK